MDRNIYNEFDEITDLVFSEEDLTSELLNLNFEQLMKHIANSPSLTVNLPLKPNQTWGTEKISIRVPRYILNHFRAEALKTSMGYQTLINMQLNEVFEK